MQLNGTFTVEELWEDMNCLSDEDFEAKYYYTGRALPRYPVPAIPHEVEIWSSAVMVAEMNDPQYKYGLITLYPHN